METQNTLSEKKHALKSGLQKRLSKEKIKGKLFVVATALQVNAELVGDDAREGLRTLLYSAINDIEKLI